MVHWGQPPRLNDLSDFFRRHIAEMLNFFMPNQNIVIVHP